MTSGTRARHGPTLWMIAGTLEDDGESYIYIGHEKFRYEIIEFFNILNVKWQYSSSDLVIKHAIKDTWVLKHAPKLVDTELKLQKIKCCAKFYLILK